MDRHYPNSYFTNGDSLDVTISGRTIILESDVSGTLVLNALALRPKDPDFGQKFKTPILFQKTIKS